MVLAMGWICNEERLGSRWKRERVQMLHQTFEKAEEAGVGLEVGWLGRIVG